MDVAYDHIQEEIFNSADNNNNNNNVRDKKDSDSKTNAAGTESETGDSQQQQNQNLDLGAEFQESFRSLTANPWGARLGGLWGNVRRQGETYYEGARQEYSAASEEAMKGFTDLRNTIIGRTRGLSLSGLGVGETEQNTSRDHQDDDAATITEATAGESASKRDLKGDGEGEGDDGEGFVSRFRAEAAKRLKDIEKAEDAADEALLKFGTNIRNFMRDAVSIAPPDDSEQGKSSQVLFESKDADGKRVIHTTRLEAQLHAIHSNLESLSKDPDSKEWDKWNADFKVDSKTDDIAADLETYPELRRAMERLVPEKVEYAVFWRRYYFLRMVIETEEKRRRELLKGLSFPNYFELPFFYPV